MIGIAAAVLALLLIGVALYADWSARTTDPAVMNVPRPGPDTPPHTEAAAPTDRPAAPAPPSLSRAPPAAEPPTALFAPPPGPLPPDVIRAEAALRSLAAEATALAAETAKRARRQSAARAQERESRPQPTRPRTAAVAPPGKAAPVASTKATPQPAAPTPRGSDPNLRPAGPFGIRIFIHHAETDLANAALAPRLADHLRNLGFEVGDIRMVRFPIEQPSVRYFFEADQTSSERLVTALELYFDNTPAQAPAAATDFTHYTPKPRLGSVELWLRTS